MIFHHIPTSSFLFRAATPLPRLAPLSRSERHSFCFVIADEIRFPSCHRCAEKCERSSQCARVLFHASIEIAQIQQWWGARKNCVRKGQQERCCAAAPSRASPAANALLKRKSSHECLTELDLAQAPRPRYWQ